MSTPGEKEEEEEECAGWMDGVRIRHLCLKKGEVVVLGN